jgi:hypothetical protein
LSRQSEEALQAAAFVFAQVNISEGVRVALTRAVENHAWRTAVKNQGHPHQRKLEIRTRRPFKAA